MPTYKRADKSVEDLAQAILLEFESHGPLLDARVKIDFLFAFADLDKHGMPRNNALVHNGVKALGLARKLPLKQRAMGRGDVEVSLDGDWWKEASEAEQKALLDHELHHFCVMVDSRGIMRDDLNRPRIQLRKHDFEFGWFSIIAERHGDASQERKVAQAIMDRAGQYFWPQFFGQK